MMVALFRPLLEISNWHFVNESSSVFSVSFHNGMRMTEVTSAFDVDTLYASMRFSSSKTRVSNLVRLL